MKCDQCHIPKAQSTSLSDYAAACRDCHNDRYEGFIYDWMKTFREYETKSEVQMEQIPRKSQIKREQLRQRIEEADKIGVHNVQLSQDLWMDILESSNQ